MISWKLGDGRDVTVEPAATRIGHSRRTGREGRVFRRGKLGDRRDVTVESAAIGSLAPQGYALGGSYIFQYDALERLTSMTDWQNNNPATAPTTRPTK